MWIIYGIRQMDWNTEYGILHSFSMSPRFAKAGSRMLDGRPGQMSFGGSPARIMSRGQDSRNRQGFTTVEVFRGA